MGRGARRASWPLVAAAAVGGLGELARRRRVARAAPAVTASPSTAETAAPPPLTSQSSPGQIADLQQAYGADMAPPSVELPDAPGPHG